jgi:hypothetical protein
MEIVDLENKLVQEFVYNGAGIGKSAASLPFSYSPNPSEWYEFWTKYELALSDFEGPAFHTAIKGQVPVMPGVAPGFKGDLVILTLAHSRRRHDWVHLTFKKWTNFDISGGIGGMQTAGVLQPTDNLGPSIFHPEDP